MFRRNDSVNNLIITGVDIHSITVNTCMNTHNETEPVDVCDNQYPPSMETTAG